MRRIRARPRVPWAAVRAQRLQLFELSAPRRCLAQDFFPRQKTSPLQALQRAQTPELRGAILIKLSSSNLSPVATTASRIARLTAGSRARSAGSSKWSDLRMCVTTMSSGRPGMASCVSPARRFRSRARVSIPHVALEDMSWGLDCAGRFGLPKDLGVFQSRQNAEMKNSDEKPRLLTLKDLQSSTARVRTPTSRSRARDVRFRLGLCARHQRRWVWTRVSRC